MGKTIVISGVFSKHTRDEYKELIEKHGGKNASSVSGNTSFILSGENMGESKKEKAAELGVPLISESEFLQNNWRRLINTLADFNKKLLGLQNGII